MKKVFPIFLMLILVGCGLNHHTDLTHLRTENSSHEETEKAYAVSEGAKPATDMEDVANYSSEIQETQEDISETEETFKPSTNIKDSEALWGIFTPDTAQNDYVKEIMKVRAFEGGTLTQTYEADYDGNGKQEAFVFCGEYAGSEFSGDLWFVDETMSATCIEKNMYAYMEQVYYKDFQQTYLLFSHTIGNPTNTEIYTVKEGKAINIADNSPNQKWVDEDGYIIFVQESYDALYDAYAGEAEGLWTGHTWKFYPFYFLGGKLTEVEARETDLETMDKMAPLPEQLLEALTDTDEKKVASAQFIYREKTRQMIVNIAYDISKDETVCYQFTNFTFRLTKEAAQNWEYVEAGSGIYNVQLSEDAFWEFTYRLENIETE